ncbi:unnamed protein product [Albugo candida]|uniref:Uncharacterized protein n=1 Tax=Albugo candida TaxID=65357 RepID=A0A024FYM8_9STRA|nr:unnamed protein product [Albugo candida]|eukprot:CCI11779.1 unnamed protein product [Albugo candida]
MRFNSRGSIVRTKIGLSLLNRLLLLLSFAIICRSTYGIARQIPLKLKLITGRLDRCQDAGRSSNGRSPRKVKSFNAIVGGIDYVNRIDSFAVIQYAFKTRLGSTLFLQYHSESREIITWSPRCSLSTRLPSSIPQIPKNATPKS